MATSPRTNPETTSSRRSGPTTTLVVAAALTLLSPVLLALLHQDALHGRRCRPLDVEAFVHTHVRSWLSGHAPR